MTSLLSNQGNASSTTRRAARVGNQSGETQSNESCKYCIDHRNYDVIFQPTIASRHYDLVLLITSSHRPGAKERRQAIRQSWGNDSFYTAKKVSHVFLLGECYLDKILTFLSAHCYTSVIKNRCTLSSSVRITTRFPPLCQALKKFSDFPSIFAFFSPIEIFSQCGVNFKTNMYGNNYFYTCLK